MSKTLQGHHTEIKQKTEALTWRVLRIHTVERVTCDADMLQVALLFAFSENITHMSPNHSIYSDTDLCWSSSYLSRADVYSIFVVSFVSGL